MGKWKHMENLEEISDFLNQNIGDVQYYMLQVYTTVIHNFYTLYSIYSYHKILAIFFLCCTIDPCSLFST